MLISKICIKRPVFATVLSLIIITLGAVFFTKLQIRGTPDISVPIITVSATYDGADASYMEKEVTTRIEKELKTIKNIDSVSSSSTTGSSQVTLTFLLSADIETALNDVRSKISDITYLFPKDMKAPSVAKLDSDNFPSIFLSISSDMYTDLELTAIVSEKIQTVLDKLESVGKSEIYGGKYYSMRIEPDPLTLYKYKIPLLLIEDAIKKQNQSYPAGIIKTPSKDFTVKLDGTLNTPEEFGNVILKVKDGSVVKLKDLAKVYLGPPDTDVIFRYNGKNSIALGLIKQSKANILDLSKEVRSSLESIKKTIPSGIIVDIAYDSSVPVSASINSVFHTIVESLLLVIIVTYLFLASVRITIIPLVTIPVSLIGTFTIMYFFGFSINIFTLLAMMLAIGLVVDDAIVMLENIFRYNEMGRKPIEAAIEASQEIGFAIIAMTITLASVFLPIGFIDGFIGKLFIEFAWTLAFCVLFSGFVALTLTPMMASRMIKKNDKPLPWFIKKFNQLLQLINDKYLYYLNLTFHRKKTFSMVIGSSVVVLVISFVLVQKVFVPQEDDGFLQIAFRGPEGSSLQHSQKIALEAEEVLKSYKDILGYLVIVGWGGGDSAFAFVPLKDWKERKMSQSSLKNNLNSGFTKIAGMSIFAMDPRSLVSGNAKSPIEFTLQTTLEYEELDKISREFVNRMNKNPIFMNVDSDLKSSMPTVNIIVNRDKAYMYNVSLEKIGTTVQYLIAGRQIGDFRMGNDLYDVTMQYNLKHRNNLKDFSTILIPTNDPDSNLLPLSVVAQIKETISTKSYNHYNNSRSVTISSDMAPKQKLTDAMQELSKIANDILDPNTTVLQYIGEIKRMMESDSNLAITFLFALLFIYLVLSAQFESFTDPILILLAVPFSITGGVLALLVFGNTINMYSNIGLITLVGLITKNSIMIVEFANKLKEQGLNIREAVIKASTLRLRPILMTTTATIMGAVPLVTASGAGAAAQNSIGLVIVGGMSVGTLFTLFVIPVLYDSFKRA